MTRIWLSVFVLGIIAMSSALAQSVSTLRSAGEQALAAGHYTAAYKYLLAAAEQGDAEAQYKISWMYSEGKGTPRNQAAQIEWLTKSAEQGYAEAELDLAFAYESGDGVPQDRAEGIAWNTKSADQGDVEAEYLLGLTYMYGGGGLYPTDYKKGFTWLSKAAAQGNVDAEFEIGKAYEHGRGVVQDSAIAVGIFKGIAEQGGDSGAGALLQLSGIYAIYEFDNDGKTVHSSEVEEYKWLELYYVAGLASSQGQGNPWPWEDDPSMGMGFLEGDMTREQINEAQQAATVWWNSYGRKYENAKANQGKAPAGALLGADGASKYESGEFSAAYEDWLIGAEHGDAVSQYYLGTYYEDGKGAPRNYLLAFSWYIKSAEQGYLLAQGKVGDYYMEGQGVQQDYVEAYGWLMREDKTAKSEMGATFIIKDTEEKLNQLGRKMTPEQFLRLVLATNGTLTKGMHDEFWAPYKGAPQSQVAPLIKAMKASLSMVQDYEVEIWKCAQISYETRQVYKSPRLLELQREYPVRLAKATSLNPNDQEFKDFMASFQTSYQKSLSHTDELLNAAANHQSIVTPEGATVQVNEALIQQVLAGIKGSAARLRELLNPQWNGG